MAEQSNLFVRLTKLFRSGPVVKRKIRNASSGQKASTALEVFRRAHSDVYNSTLSAYGSFDRMSRYSDFSEMESTPEISSALDIYAEETVAADEHGRVLHIHSDNSRIKEILENLFHDILNVEFNLPMWSRNLCKYGDFFLFNDLHPDYGIINAYPISISEIEREENFDAEDPSAVRFRWITQGNQLLENWQVSHFRLLGNDAFLPYLDINHENYLEPTHGYKLFKSSMDKAARGWKNKTLKLIFGSFFKKTNWSRINSLNWKDEIFKKETISYKNKPSDPNEHLSLIIDNNIRLWSIISQGMNIDISYVLQPVGSWSKKELTDEEKKLFSEEILIEGQDRIYKHIDFKKYNLIKSILEHSTKKYKINFLDLNAHFNNEKYNNEWLFLSRFHFNDVGNKHLSSYLISKLF